MADPSQEPYATLITRVRAGFHDAPSSPDFEDADIVNSLFNALCTVNLEQSTGFTIESEEITGGTFNVWSNEATVIVLAAIAELADRMVSMTNRDSMDIRKRGLAFSISNQVRAWDDYSERKQRIADHAIKRFIYGKTTGERITYDIETELQMDTGSTIS
jgi:hypothetical protein